MPDLAPLLDTKAVGVFLALRDRGAIHRVMQDAGGCKVAGRWRVSARALEAWLQGEADSAQVDPGALSDQRSLATSPGTRGRALLPALEPGWFLKA